MHTSERADGTAKRLRRDANLSEQRLWKVLKKLDLGGGHFRRQAPLGPYIVDFVHHGARLVIEVDGGIHRLPAVTQRDEEREAWLTQRRYAVVRVTNTEALYAPHDIAQRIADQFGAGAPTPTPPREGEGLR